MSTPLLLEVAAETDTNPTSFYRGVGPVWTRSALDIAMSVHPTYFDLATLLDSRIQCKGVISLKWHKMLSYRRAVEGPCEHPLSVEILSATAKLRKFPLN